MTLGCFVQRVKQIKDAVALSRLLCILHENLAAAVGGAAIQKQTLNLAVLLALWLISMSVSLWAFTSFNFLKNSISAFIFYKP